MIDLKGQTLVLLARPLLQALALISFAALPGDAALPVIIGLAALTGASQPPLGATVRALWARDLDDDTRHVLFTGESAVLEGIYIAGPVLIVAGIGGVLSISAAALACGVFTLLGTVLFVLTRASRAWRPEPDRVRGIAGALAVVRRADPARHDGRARHRRRRHRGRGPGPLRARRHAQRHRLRVRPVGPRQPDRRRRREPPQRRAATPAGA